MTRPRPYIPLSVRLKVVKRMLRSCGKSAEAMVIDHVCKTLTDRIAWGLSAMGLHDAQLDHDPALILREFNNRTGRYTPAANDPDHLIYRAPRAHLQKTIGRRADAEKTVTTKGSDIWLKSKFRRLEQPRKKPKAKIPQRAKPWPKRGFAKRAPR